MDSCKRDWFRIPLEHNFCLYVERSKHFSYLLCVNCVSYVITPKRCEHTVVPSVWPAHLWQAVLCSAISCRLVPCLEVMVYGISVLISFAKVQAHLICTEWFICLKLRMCLDEMKNYEFVQVPGWDVCVQALLLLCNGPVGKHEILSVMNKFYH